ncbi:hypothetical protein B7463_g1788, partial [Scytalidium lignicola]
MTTKNPSSIDTGDESLPPPSYTETISNLPQSSPSGPYSTQITSLLLHLTNQVASAQTQRNLLNTARDSKVLSALTSAIQSYLSSFAESSLQKGTLILIPASALRDQNAVPCEHDFANPAEYDRVVRVSIGEKGDLSDNLWFWKDEDMARRLAGYIAQPKLAALPPRQPEQQVSPMGNKSSGKSFWRKKSNSKSVERSMPEQVQDKRETRSDVDKASLASVGQAAWQYEVEMDVKAEEVVFRTENELGLYETERGWSILLKLNIFLSK